MYGRALIGQEINWDLFFYLAPINIYRSNENYYILRVASARDKSLPG